MSKEYLNGHEEAYYNHWPQSVLPDSLHLKYAPVGTHSQLRWVALTLQ